MKWLRLPLFAVALCAGCGVQNSPTTQTSSSLVTAQNVTYLRARENNLWGASIAPDGTLQILPGAPYPVSNISSWVSSMHIDSADRFVVTCASPNSTGVGTMTIFGRNADGSLASKSQEPPGCGKLAIDSGANLLFVSQSLSIMSYRIDPTTLALTPTNSLPAPDFPLGVYVNSAMHYLYVFTEDFSDCVHADCSPSIGWVRTYSYDNTGALTPIFPDRQNLGNVEPWTSVMDPAGRYWYVMGVVNDRFAILTYSFQPDGSLTFGSTNSDVPDLLASLAISHSGKYLYASTYTTGNVRAYSFGVDEKSGVVTTLNSWLLNDHIPSCDCGYFYFFAPVETDDFAVAALGDGNGPNNVHVLKIGSDGKFVSDNVQTINGVLMPN